MSGKRIKDSKCSPYYGDIYAYIFDKSISNYGIFLKIRMLTLGYGKSEYPWFTLLMFVVSDLYIVGPFFTRILSSRFHSPPKIRNILYLAWYNIFRRQNYKVHQSNREITKAVFV